MVDIQALCNWIGEMKVLSLEMENERVARCQKLTTDFSDFIDDVVPVYREALRQARCEYVEPFLGEHDFLRRKSVLEVLRKGTYEPYYTLLLAESLKHPQVLNGFLKAIELNIPLPKERIYEVFPEDRNKDKEKTNIPDITIVSPSGRWVLVIENKVKSPVDRKEDQTQLERYFHCIESKKEYTGYDKYYVLLSYTNNRKFLKDSDPWKYCDYQQLFRSILECGYRDKLTEELLGAIYGLFMWGQEGEIGDKNTLYSIYNFYKELCRN